MADIHIDGEGWRARPDLFDPIPSVQDQVVKQALKLLNRGHAVKLSAGGIELMTLFPDGRVEYPGRPKVIEWPIRKLRR